ncbi:MAG: peptidylprolyl isomerase, partial [Proteobacteria bacterium]|nr:peptidylprolyl isomerase [Pseudomonadota bacterium]
MTKPFTLATSTLLAVVLVFGSLTACQAKDAGAAKEDSAMQMIDEMIQKAKVDTSKPNWKTAVPKPEKATFDPAHKYFASMLTNKGTLRIRLLPDVAPMHVTSFIYLTKLGFYDGLSFHRVITGFMAHGGCPLGNGTGGPGYE